MLAHVDLDSYKTGNYGEDAYNEKPVMHCDICGNNIYEGDKYYRVNGVAYCEGCIEDLTEFA